jgi:hypothetical protein
MHGRDEKCIEYFDRKTWKRPLREPALRWEGTKDVEWILLAQDRVRSRVLLNFIMNIWIP